MSEAIATIKTLVSSLRSDFVDAFDSREKLHLLKPKTKLKDSTPAAELIKLSQIIKAQTTKIGIISHPAKFHANLDAAGKELKEFSNTIFFLVSLVPLFYQGKFPKYFIDLLDSNILGLLNGVSGFCDDLDQLVSSHNAMNSSDITPGPSTQDEDDSSGSTRLLSVGKIWASCDLLNDIGTNGNLGLLNKRIQISAKLVTDTLNELEEWLVEPHVETDDPFGIGSGSEDEENELEDEDNDAGLGESVPPGLIGYVQKWQNKLKMIRLLLSSFSKSIASNDYKGKEPSAQQLDKLNDLHALIVEETDELISTTFMAGQDFDADDDEIIELASNLNTTVRQMVQIIKNLNKSDEKKGKWIQVWDTKYFS
ncbi:LADA_0F04720g1_1 [Lachancea dasiensis]|uniref:LADA_0F04720g1_1 n=1 Tax=Lachancea dasiensis TaxID=1072105 RepID=A0A1G4JJ50_9SACH|nr:LADA_0F04720g1_1 [Lachancea dasiensis]